MGMVLAISVKPIGHCIACSCHYQFSELGLGDLVDHKFDRWHTKWPQFGHVEPTKKWNGSISNKSSTLSKII